MESITVKVYTGPHRGKLIKCGAEIQRKDGISYDADVHYYGQMNDDTLVFGFFYVFDKNDVNIDFYINGKDLLYLTPNKNTDRKIIFHVKSKHF